MEKTKAAPDPYSVGYDFLILNSPMDERAFPKLLKCVTGRKDKSNKKLFLSVVTYGGSADVAYRIGRFLQSAYDDITVFIPSLCKSAGTLLAISGKKLVFSPFGEMGPLDVQLRRKDEIHGRRSGLVTRAALEDLRTHALDLFEHMMLNIVEHSGGSVSFKVAADIASKTAAEALGKIYEQINPDSLGQDYRDLNVATKYCERLKKWSDNIDDAGIKRLVHEYPSHDFVIDAEEAKEIFKTVDGPTSSIYHFMTANISELMNPFPSSRAIANIVTLTHDEDDDDALGGPPTSNPSNEADTSARDEERASNPS